MKNKRTLLFAGILAAFLMLAVPFAVVSFDSGDSYAASITVDNDNSLNEAINKGNPSSVDVTLAEGDYKEIEVSIDHSEAKYENVSDDEFTNVRVYSREISSIIIDGSESSSVSGFIFKVGFRTVYKNADGSGGLDYYCFNKFKVGNLTIRNITLNQSDIVSLDNNQYGVPLEIGKIFFENVTFNVESSDGAISHTIIGNNTVIGSIEYDGCNFIGNTEYSTQNGILVDSRSPNGVDITVKDCTFNNIGYNAVQISGTGSNYAGNISLMGNTVDTTGDRAFRISRVSDASKINIYNNTLIGCEDELFSAFKVEAEKGNIQSSGNTLNGQPFGIIEADIGTKVSPNYLYNNSIKDILTEIKNINSISFNSDYLTSDLITIEASKDISIIGKPGCLLNGLKIVGNEHKVTISGINSVGAGILVQNAGTVKIDGCNVSGITNETTIPGINGMFGGIGVQNATSVEITSNVVGDNAYLTYKDATKEVNGAGNGIVVSVISGNVTVSGNTVDTVAYTAMYADNVGGSLTIFGNTFEEWNSVNIHDGGRGIRATIVGSIDVHNNDFIKDYSTIPMNDIGNLFKVDGFTKEGTVKFYDNKINRRAISIDEKNITANNGDGFFFDADVSFDADSVSVVDIDAGFYYWSNVEIFDNVSLKMNDDAEIKIYGVLIVNKQCILHATQIEMVPGSKLISEGTVSLGEYALPSGTILAGKNGLIMIYSDAALNVMGDVAFDSGFKTTNTLSIVASGTLSISANGTSEFAGLIVNGGGYDITISGINSVGAGILVSNAGSVNIENCTVSNVDQESVYFGGNIFGIGASDVDSITIVGCDINNVESTERTEVSGKDGIGIFLDQIKENVIIGGQNDTDSNTVVCTGHNAILITLSSADVTIQNNEISDWTSNTDKNCGSSPGEFNAGRALRTVATGKTVTISDNVFSKTYSGALVDLGNVAKITGANSVSFSNNSMSGIGVLETISSEASEVFIDAGTIIENPSFSNSSESAKYYCYGIKASGTVTIEEDVNFILTYGGVLELKAGTIITGAVIGPDDASVSFVGVTAVIDSTLTGGSIGMVGAFSSGSMDVNDDVVLGADYTDMQIEVTGENSSLVGTFSDVEITIKKDVDAVEARFTDGSTVILSGGAEFTGEPVFEKGTKLTIGTGPSAEVIPITETSKVSSTGAMRTGFQLPIICDNGSVYYRGLEVFSIEVFVGDIYGDYLDELTVKPNAGYVMFRWADDSGMPINDSQTIDEGDKLTAVCAPVPVSSGAGEEESAGFDIADHVVLIEAVIAVLVLIGFVSYIRKN